MPNVVVSGLIAIFHKLLLNFWDFPHNRLVRLQIMVPKKVKSAVSKSCAEENGVRGQGSDHRKGTATQTLSGYYKAAAAAAE